ncbi:MAG: hypothetical protein U1F65_04235 [Verrucomicrobiota bacterium]
MVNHRSHVLNSFVGVAVAALLLTSQNESHGSVVNDGTTRVQQTAFDPAFEGFYAALTQSLFGEPAYSASATHLWGPYYAVGAHEVTGSTSVEGIFLGSDYVNGPGTPISISSVDISPFSDLAIITASVADNSPRDPTSKLVGIAVARQGGAQNPDAGTIVNYFATAQNLQFINQITGTNITISDVLSGNSIFAAPQVGMVVRGKGFGVWGNLNGSLNLPDGKAGEWWTTVDASGPDFAGAWNYVNTNFYILTKRTLDPLGGTIGSFDSGSPVITIVPEPAFRILSLTVTNGSVTLQWESQNGKTYHVQSVETLTNTWTNLGSPIPATNSTTSFVDTPPVQATQRFYRVVRE